MPAIPRAGYGPIMQPLKADLILCASETRDRAARLAQHALLVDHQAIMSFDAEDTRDDYNSDAISRAPRATDVAYAVFTSGSTGAAKGVKISHTNLSTSIYHQAGPGPHKYGLTASSRSLDSSSYAFDACVCNFFYTVTQGGCLCVPSEQALRGDIAGFMREVPSRLGAARAVGGEDGRPGGVAAAEDPSAYGGAARQGGHRDLGIAG